MKTEEQIEKTKSEIEVMQAFIDGNSIETRFVYNDRWADEKTPYWDWVNFEYRVKGKAKEEPKCICDENNMAEVILTKAGAKIINSYSEFLNRYASTDTVNFKTDYKEDDSYVSELWNIMKIFYGESHGTEKCFKKIMIF